MTQIEINYNDFPHARGHEDRVYADSDGELRYRPNKIIRFAVDTGKISTNEVMIMYVHEMISLEDAMEFYRLLGYSLDRFEEIWYNKDPVTRTTPDD